METRDSPSDLGFLLQSLVLSTDGNIPGWSEGDPIPDPWLPQCNVEFVRPTVTVVGFPAPSPDGWWNLGGCWFAELLPARVRFDGMRDWEPVLRDQVVEVDFPDQWQWTFSIQAHSNIRGTIIVYLEDLEGTFSEWAFWRTNGG